MFVVLLDRKCVSVFVLNPVTPKQDYKVLLWPSESVCVRERIENWINITVSFRIVAAAVC